ncbi:MAG: Ig-like domain-containing protein [Vicinamibacterales bacterium]
MRPLASILLLLALTAANAASMQAPVRHVTTAHALSQYGHFFHGAQISFLGTVTEAGGLPVVSIGETQHAAVTWQQPQAPDGQVVLRGTFLDLGRLEANDPRLNNIDTQRILDTLNEGRWPGRDRVFLLTGASYEKYEPAVQPNLRAIALDPARYVSKQVTISGRFRGKNLLGDQPVSPGKSPHEYVMRVADASVWVSGLRPRGRGFTLDPDSRRDTREWVRVTGIVRHAPPLVWIEGKTIDLAKPETETARDVPAPLPPGPPPEIVFSAPLDGETDVPTSTVLRVQFSRDIDPASLEDQVAVAYGLRPDGSSPGRAPGAETKYLPANRAVEIRFTEPLAPFTTVMVAFGNAIKATDGVAMKPARIAFVTGR